MKRYDINEQAGEETGDVSKINAAGLINLRIQDAWNACTRHYNNGEYDGLRDELFSLWPEFYADAKTDQIAKVVKLDKAISKMLRERNRSYGNKKRWVFYNIRYKHAVYQKWLFLKTMEKDQGTGKAYYDESQDDWE